MTDEKITNQHFKKIQNPKLLEINQDHLKEMNNFFKRSDQANVPRKKTTIQKVAEAFSCISIINSHEISDNNSAPTNNSSNNNTPKNV